MGRLRFYSYEVQGSKTSFYKRSGLPESPDFLQTICYSLRSLPWYFWALLYSASGMGNLKLNLSGGPDLRMAGSHFSSISLYPNAIHLMCFSQKSPFTAALLWGHQPAIYPQLASNKTVPFSVVRPPASFDFCSGCDLILSVLWFWKHLYATS